MDSGIFKICNTHVNTIKDISSYSLKKSGLYYNEITAPLKNKRRVKVYVEQIKAIDSKSLGYVSIYKWSHLKNYFDIILDAVINVWDQEKTISVDAYYRGVIPFKDSCISTRDTAFHLRYK